MTLCRCFVGMETFVIICIEILGIGILFASRIVSTVEFYREEKMRDICYRVPANKNISYLRNTGCIICLLGIILLLIFNALHII